VNYSPKQVYGANVPGNRKRRPTRIRPIEMLRRLRRSRLRAPKRKSSSESDPSGARRNESDAKLSRRLLRRNWRNKPRSGDGDSKRRRSGKRRRPGRRRRKRTRLGRSVRHARKRSARKQPRRKKKRQPKKKRTEPSATGWPRSVPRRRRLRGKLGRRQRKSVRPRSRLSDWKRPGPTSLRAKSESQQSSPKP
jgi:hypothetical protein